MVQEGGAPTPCLFRCLQPMVVGGQQGSAREMLASCKPSWWEASPSILLGHDSLCHEGKENKTGWFL